MENDKITVLMVEPEKKPYVKEIDPGLSSLQHEVGGYIQAVYPFAEPVAIICDEEAKLIGKPLNRALRDEDGDIYEITTEPDDFDAVKTDLEKKGYTFVSAEIEKVPSTYVTLTNEDDLKHMELLLDHLEEDEDIVNVWHNWDEQ